MKKLFVIILFIASILAACKKNDSSEIDYNPNVLSSKDYIRGEDAIFEVVNSFYKGVYDSLVTKNGYNYIDNCDVTYHPDQNVLSFSYGSVNRHCDDNKFRRGQFFAAFSGTIFEEGVVARIVTDSLFVDDCLEEMVMDIENLGMNGQSKNEFALRVDSSNIILPDTNKLYGVRISSDFTMIWEEGASTPPIHEDDMFLINGSASGISAEGYQFTTIIQEPLKDYLDCFWISWGINEITVPAGKFTTGEIDYIQDDGCFNKFYFYFNNSTFYDEIK